MPDSGAWASEHVFSIPLAPGSADSRSPGLVVFECSPLHGLEDEIEKCVIHSGYLSLSMLTHIRAENIGYLMTVRAYVKRSKCFPRTDISSPLCCSYSGVRPRPRHCRPICMSWYVPRLTFSTTLTPKQVGDYATKGVIGSYATFSLSSKTTDLDEKFTEILSSMNLDTEGGLVQILTRQGKRTNGFRNGSERSCFS
jgi:hypothetical protein